MAINSATGRRMLSGKQTTQKIELISCCTIFSLVELNEGSGYHGCSYCYGPSKSVTHIWDSTKYKWGDLTHQELSVLEAVYSGRKQTYYVETYDEC